MKNVAAIFTLALLFVSSIAFGQDAEAPKKGAKIHIENKALDLEVGGEQTFDVWVLRSKRAQRATFKTPKFVGSKDFTFDVQVDPENKDHFIVTAKPNSATTGKYIFTVKSGSTGSQVISGTTMSLNVSATNSVAKSQ